MKNKYLIFFLCILFICLFIYLIYYKINIKNGKCIQFVTDNIKSSQHRFYRRLMLPAITEALGESNNQYVHDFILKPEWIYRQTGKYHIEIDGYSEIPDKHKSSARIIK